MFYSKSRKIARIEADLDRANAKITKLESQFAEPDPLRLFTLTFAAGNVIKVVGMTTTLINTTETEKGFSIFAVVNRELRTVMYFATLPVMWSSVWLPGDTQLKIGLVE